MKTSLAFEVMKKVLPDVAEIVSDESIAEFKKIVAKKDNDTAGMMQVLIPMFADKRRAALVRILSEATGKSVEEIEEQDFKLTIADMQDGFVGDMISFFILCMRMVGRM